LPGSKRFGFGPVHLLFLLAVGELIVYRIAVPAVQVVVPFGDPVPVTPIWQALLGWLGLFLHYFVGTLAIGLLLARAARVIRLREVGAARVRELATAVAAVGVGVLAAVALVLGEDAGIAFAIETALAIAMVVGFAAAIRRDQDPEPMTGFGVLGPVVSWLVRYGAMYGLGFVIAPFVIHYYGVIGGKFLWPEGAAEIQGPTAGLARIGVSALCLAAIASPYCFGPRPFARSVGRIPPVVVAMVVAAGSAVLARRYYLPVADIVWHATGVQLTKEDVDPQLALYILAFATLCWTLASCAIADTEPRRRVGLGLGLIVLGGYHDVVWPTYYAVIAVGLFTIVDAIPELRAAERVERIEVATPAIEDRIWQTWVTTLVGGLRAAGHQVHALTSRGDDDHTSTVVSGEVGSRPFRMRIERVGGSVVVIDVRFGREVGDQRPATFTIHARREGLRDAHPEPPASGARVELGDAAFADRFRARGDRAALLATLDEDVRVRLTATMDGWLAVWSGESVRHRVYPGRGAPIDHPIPLSDLALRGAGADGADRLITTIAVLADVARRALPTPIDEPAHPVDPALDGDDHGAADEGS